MFFSIKCVMLTEILTSPPVNNTRFVYISRNGVHYEPLFGVHSLQILANNVVVKINNHPCEYEFLASIWPSNIQL